MSGDEKTDYDELVKDHIRLRLMESGWTNQVSKFVKNAISKRIENDQAPNTIKFEQLYEDVINKARDAISDELEDEFHQKVGEYLSLNLDGTSGSKISSVVPPLCDSPDVSMDVATNNDGLDTI